MVFGRPTYRFWAPLALVGMTAWTPGCRNRSDAPRMRYAGEVAYGRPDSCPDDAVDPMGDGTPGPMDMRCSYANTTGALTRVKGRVLVEATSGGLGNSPGRVVVFVHEAPAARGGPLGRKAAEATTDPQGVFSIAADLPDGDYVIAVQGERGKVRARQRVTVGGDAGRKVEGVRVVIPRPMDDVAP